MLLEFQFLLYRDDLIMPYCFLKYHSFVHNLIYYCPKIYSKQSKPMSLIIINKTNEYSKKGTETANYSTLTVQLSIIN